MNLQPIDGKTRSAQVADQLRSHVLGGGFAPGSRLTEIDLAERLGVSRGPLREALLKLTEEGLLVKEPYKAIRVRDISVKEVQELYSLRTNLEQFAFRECWARRDPGRLAELCARLAALNHARAEGADADVIDCEIAFHSWVFECSDHSLLQACWTNIKPLLKLYLSVHRQRFGPAGVFSKANEDYAVLAQGEDLDAMLEHVGLHMSLGLREVMRSLPAE